ncbi:hypothetical protein SLE2022_163080 [Rubroshorea leprosula]
MDKPLQKSSTIKMTKIETKKVRIKYKQLLEFCYACGCIGHVEADFDISFCLKEANYKITKFYGPRLRAEVNGWSLKNLENLELSKEINKISKELDTESIKAENKRLMVKEESRIAPSI